MVMYAAAAERAQTVIGGAVLGYIISIGPRRVLKEGRYTQCVIKTIIRCP